MGDPLFEPGAVYYEPQRRLPGLEQLICAALADRQLANNLLNDPANAIEHLPIGIALTAQERALVTRITGVITLEEFAARLDVLMRRAAID